jgi:hypothetical protein
MNKKVKIALIVVVSLFVTVIALAITLPIIYKDDIKKAIDDAIAEKVNATVKFDADKFDVTLFSDFPNLTVSLQDLGVINAAPFEGDTLVAIKEFEIGINLLSLISGDKIKINSVTLTEPYINIKVLADGRANYDIMKPDSTATTPEDEKSEPSTLAIAIKKWEIIDGKKVVYSDATMPMLMEVVGFQHEGSGDFSKDIFDMVTKTSISGLDLTYDGVKYLKATNWGAYITMEMDLAQMKFTLKDNSVRLNDLTVGADGYYQLLADRHEMDINFKSDNNEFKNILSLVPGVYKEGFDKLKTSGTLGFDGFVKGTFSDTKMPGIKVNLLVEKGMFQYPELPTAVNNIFVDMTVDAADGVYDNALVDIKKFHVDLGKNPVDGKVSIRGFDKMDINADVSSTFDLADVSKMFPVQGVKSLAGMFSLNLKAAGIYSDTLKLIPTIQAVMKLENGIVHPSDYPVPLEKINVFTSINNETGKLNDTRIDVTRASMTVSGEPFEASAKVYNFADITYDAQVRGNLDMSMVTKLAPMDGVTMKGKMKADIQTKGKMSDINAGKYDRLPTSGTFSLANFEYVDKALLPQGMKIAEADLSFTPQAVNLKKFISTIGKSDVALTGQLTNYIPFLFSDKAVLKGNLDLTSQFFDANEFIPAEAPKPATPVKDTAIVATGLPVPANIDFKFDADIKKVLYTNLELTNLKGDITVKDQVVSLNNLNFTSLGGVFVVNGSADAKNPNNPAFNASLSIKDLAFSDAYQQFASIKALAPIAQNMKGKFSTDFKINGFLDKALSPDLKTLAGNALVNIKDTKLDGVTALNSLADVTGMKSLKDPQLQDILLNGEIKNGRIFFKPFDVKTGEHKMTVVGSNGLDGSLDYVVTLRDVPVGNLAGQYLGSLGSLLGDAKVDIPVTIRGLYNKPTVTPGTPSNSKQGGGSSALPNKQEVKEKAAQTASEAIKNIAKDTTNKSIEKKAIEQGKNILKGLGF